jgi:hypothetical protein
MTVASKPDKAYLILKQPSSTGGKAKIGEVRFQFNPSQFSVTKTASWQSKPGKDAEETTMPEFTGSEPRSMSVEVFLDATDSPSHDIVKDIELLFDCCTPAPESLGKNRPSPPFVLFGWGKTMQFEAFVQSVSVNYTMFKQDGTPIRALATLALQEIPRPAQRQNPTSGALAAQRTHTVVEGDSLASIAYSEYGDPRLWRAVALANGIDDPMRLVNGTSLLLPTPEEAGEVA